MARQTFASLSRDITTEAEAYEWLEQLRWPQGVRCAHCKGTSVTFLVPANGVSRRTRTGAMSERRVWQCRDCRKQFSALTGTMMHRSKVSARTWCMVIFELCSAKNGISAREIERKYGVNPRTAWFLAQRVRAAMVDPNLSDLLTGTVEADEMYVGKRHHGKGSGPIDKIPVVTLVEKGGRARSTVVARSFQASVVVLDNVDPEATVVTDESNVYNDLALYIAKHATVNHSAKEWVRGGYTTNTVEGFFGLFRRHVTGTHHFVTNKHVGRYLAGADFMYDTRRLTDSDRMAVLGRQMERRLTYEDLKAS
jgi:transposase-like protein